MRQGRYEKLLDSGFTKWEARTLSTIPLTRVPYMKDLIRMRNIQIQEWYKNRELRSSSTRRDLNSKILNWYQQKGFTRPGTTQPDVWKLLRSIEQEFGYKYPSYVSPFRRKRQDFISFKGR
jgi:hypothetical protein